MYNSCRCRMCPKCQTLSKERWVEARKREIIPVDYFHGVFTLPHEFNQIALKNKKLIYSLLFKSVSETLQTFASTLGGQIGFISVLHTWNQKLQDHIHLHCIIPAGVYLKESKEWKGVKNKKFLFPIKGLSKVFKSKFLENIRKKSSQIEWPHCQLYLERPDTFNNFLDGIWNKDWTVYAKKPFNGAEQVINYLGRYTHRVAISNYRILKIEGSKVYFKYRDRKAGDIEKEMGLEAVEFLRRFMLHSLPKGFQKIRYHGFLCNRQKNNNLENIYESLNLQRIVMESKKLTAKDFILRVFKVDIDKCPQCKAGKIYQQDLTKERPP